jgi:uncharacterized protein (TIGR00725 family)
MKTSLILDRKAAILADATGRRFDARSRTWSAGTPVVGESIDVVAAATWLQHESGHRIRVPVGVIGPRAANAEQMQVAEQAGNGLAGMGFAIVCGGREGIMTAVAKGARAAGGTTIGLLPDTDPALANPHLDIVIATGIGEARNALIARAASCLVAIGDSYGTLSEVALGRHFGKLVIGLAGAARVDGVRHVDGVAAALTLVAQHALALAT